MLLLLHGALYTKNEFNPLAARLAESCEVGMLDFSGHGSLSEDDAPFTIRYFADDVLHWMEEHEVATVDIFGFSMGGYVGLYLARYHPEKVGRLMTLGTKLAWDPETSAREVKMLNPEKIEEKVPRFAEVLKERHGAEQWKGLLWKSAEMMTNLGNAPELPYEELSQIECPVRLNLGDRDEMVSIEETVKGYRCLPNGELAILPGVGHPVEKVPLDRLAGEIEDFFRSV